MSSEGEELQAAIEALYVTFASHPLREWTDPCLQCCTTREQAAIHSAPLRELPVDAVMPYLTDIYTWGDEREFLHLLPRVMEIMAIEQFDWPDIEFVFGKFEFAGWQTWTADEQGAVVRFCMALWKATLADATPIRGADDVLYAIGRAIDDLTPYLNAWSADQRAPARDHLSAFIDGHFNPVSGLWRAAYWDDRPDQRAQVEAWIAAQA